MADRQSRTAVDQRDGTMRILRLMFVAAIGVVLLGAVYLLSIPSSFRLEWVSLHSVST
jgi:predicted Abi (CAAX) family protease